MPPLSTHRHAPATLGALLSCLLACGCGRALRSGEPVVGGGATPSAQGPEAVRERARADSIRRPYTEADIHFMTSMIGHHAQAIVMAGWAPTHGASAELRTLAARIANAQRDEIATMQRWLRDRGLPVPEVMPSGELVMPASDTHAMHMSGMEMSHARMPGMLTEEQMRELDAARGLDFDRLFLTDMIQHHRGAVSMVRELFASYGAGQDELVFKLASEVNVDQTTEINRMQKMLLTLALQGYSDEPPASHR